jgi:hypothetical protein
MKGKHDLNEGETYIKIALKSMLSGEGQGRHFWVLSEKWWWATTMDAQWD